MSQALPFAEKLAIPCLCTPASFDYHGVININKKDSPQRRNIKICTLLHEDLHPPQLSTLLEAHACWCCPKGRNRLILFLAMPFQ